MISRLKICLVVLLAWPAAAQPWADLLRAPILTEGDRQSMMFSFVDRNLPLISVPERQEERLALRVRILKSVGLEDLEQRTPIRWIAKGAIERDTYRIEKILFESSPGMMVPALVYVPNKVAGTVPAMISIPGHVYCEGKTNESVQARCVNLARRGIIAMTYDYIDTGERNTGVNACALMPYGGGNDHGLKGFSYTSGTPTGLEILDGIRAMDYLYTRPDVDRNRLGFTGESGGSNSTYWVSALDERVKLAVPVCSVTTFDYWIRNDRNWDWHQRPAGIRRFAEISTLLAMIAPRPLLVIGSLRGTDADEFPFDQTEEAVRVARKAYESQGAARNIEIWESSTSHGYQQDKRERMYAFVERHFLHLEKALSAELAFVREPQHDLECGLPAGNRTTADVYAEWLRRPTPMPPFPTDRKNAESIQDRLRQQVRAVLGLDAVRPHPSLSVQMVGSRGDAIVRQMIMTPEPGIRVPVAEIQPRKPAVGVVIIPGKSAVQLESIASMVEAGLIVVLFDPRGTGEAESGGRRTDNWSWFVDRPWTGMWSLDIVAAASALESEHPGVKIGVIGTGQFAKAALFAAALSPRIAASAVRLENAGYREEAASGGLSDVPRILATTDLAGLAALCAPRSCRIEFPPEKSEQFRQTYAWSAKFSTMGFGTSSVELEPSAADGWNARIVWLVRMLR
jgi:cephalosporin-C deacetylase-like acetyl esterase